VGIARDDPNICTFVERVEMSVLFESHIEESSLTFHRTILAYFMPIAVQLAMQFGGMSVIPIRMLDSSDVGFVRKHP